MTLGNREMTPVPKRRRATFAAILLIVSVTLGLFAYSVHIRRPWMGTLYSSTNINLTAHTLFFARNWYQKGALNLKFASVNTIPSIENEGSKYINLYVSWPPGHLIPIHLIARITGRAPGPRLIMKYNLLIHLITTLLLVLTVFFLLIQSGISRIASSILSIVPAMIFLLTPGPLWFMQAVYQNPQAVIPLFALYLFLEALRRAPGRSQESRRILSFLQGLVIFAGVLTAYLFYLIVLVAFIIRFFNGEIRRTPGGFTRDSLLFWSPAILGGLLFLAQLLWLDSLEQFLSRGQFRAGSAGGVDWLVSRFWNTHLLYGFGQTGRILILGSLALLGILLIYFLIHRFRSHTENETANRLLSLSSLAMIPPVLHVLVLKNFNASHRFSLLKFGPALSMLPFVILPFLLFSIFSKSLGNQILSKGSRSDLTVSQAAENKFSIPIALFIFTLAMGYAISERNHMSVIFTPRSTAAVSAKHERLYRFIGGNTGYSDVIFSPFLDVNFSNKIPLLLTRHNIYRLYSPQDIFFHVRRIRRPFNVCIVLNSYESPPASVRDLIREEPSATLDGWSIHRISGKAFMDRYRKLPNNADRDFYQRERRVYESLRWKTAGLISRRKLEAALVPLRKILAFQKKHGGIHVYNRFLMTEMAIQNLLGRREEGIRIQKKLESLPMPRAVHPLWGWDPDPWTLSVINNEINARRILRKYQRPH